MPDMIDAANALSRLRAQLPDLLGSAWPDVEQRVRPALERLEEAEDDEERDTALHDAIALLGSIHAVRPHLMAALTAGREPPSVRERGIDASPSEQRDERAVATVERWPHMDVDQGPRVRPGATLKVTVYVSTDLPDDEQKATPLNLPDIDEVPLRVLLTVSRKLVIDGSDSGTIVIRKEQDRSTQVEFKVRVRDDASGEAGLIATLRYGIRPAGSVRRTIAIGADVQAPVPPVPPAPRPVCSIDLKATDPDLSIEVTRVPGGGDRLFDCTIATPHVKAMKGGEKVTWDLGMPSADRVRMYMKGFTKPNASNQHRRAALEGAGRQLFRATPARFQEIYWELSARKRPIATISVVSEEPYIPWELMVPNRDGEELPALGVAHAVGRWVHEGHRSGDQVCDLTDSLVVAPRYTGKKFLRFSDSEAQDVQKRFPGRRIDPAYFETIEDEIGAGASLLHVVCHGTVRKDGTQIIDLDSDETLEDYTLEGMKALRTAVAAQRSFVFINACDVGRPTPALVGTGGFAAAFIALGAACVIAPIWSVKDGIAAELAQKFYDRVTEQRGTPFAEILRQLRSNAYEDESPEDSWAAYCFFGDPLAASFA